MRNDQELSRGDLDDDRLPQSIRGRLVSLCRSSIVGELEPGPSGHRTSRYPTLPGGTPATGSLTGPDCPSSGREGHHHSRPAR